MLTPETVLQGRYRIVRQLGQGGMGAVYEAVDQRLDTTVALKETLFADERLRRQFEREARLLARLHHPALPRVSDHFSEADGQFLVMQFIPGDDLSEMMTSRRGPFPVDQVLTWADQLLDALDYLHTQEPQIIHRDIKPQNLKLTSRGQIILLDFGLAKGQAGEISRINTAASIFGYTPNYAPLEQIQGLGTDAHSDLYSLGATLYHLMTGVKPPDALTRAAALVNGQPDPLVKASEANSVVAPEVDHVLAKAMAQNREQRYGSAAEMSKALKATEQATTIVNRGEAKTVLLPPPSRTVAVPTQTVASEPTVRTGETTVVRPSPRRRVLPWALSIAALIVLACGVFGFYALQKRNNDVVQVTNPPGQVESPPVSSPTVGPSGNVNANPQPTNETVSHPTPAPKKQEKSSRREEEKKNPNPEQPRVEVEQGHEPDVRVNPPNIPTPPIYERPRRPQVQVYPGGVMIRKFPDGSQIITTPDGVRVLITKDGQRKVLNPARPKHPRANPEPQPSP
jgi:serine/threonine protein kinase